MATYIKIDTSNFKPFTFEDIIKPLVMQKENEDKFELALDEKQKEAALLLLLSQNDVDEEEYNTYLNYLSYLNSIADLFSKSGLAGGLGNKFRLAKNIYNTKISPIAARYTLREELKKAELALYDKDPSMLFAKPAATRKLGDYSNGMPLSLHVSGNALKEDATKFALSISLSTYGDPIISPSAISLYYLFKQQGGLTKERMQELIKSENSIVQNYMDDVRTKIGYDNYSPEERLAIDTYIYEGLMLGAVQTQQVKELRNLSVSARALSGGTSRATTKGGYIIGPDGKPVDPLEQEQPEDEEGWAYGGNLNKFQEGGDTDDDDFLENPNWDDSLKTYRLESVKLYPYILEQVIDKETGQPKQVRLKLLRDYLEYLNSYFPGVSFDYQKYINGDLKSRIADRINLIKSINASRSKVGLEPINNAMLATVLQRLDAAVNHELELNSIRNLYANNRLNTAKSSWELENQRRHWNSLTLYTLPQQEEEDFQQEDLAPWSEGYIFKRLKEVFKEKGLPYYSDSFFKSLARRIALLHSLNLQLLEKNHTTLGTNYGEYKGRGYLDFTTGNNDWGIVMDSPLRILALSLKEGEDMYDYSRYWTEELVNRVAEMQKEDLPQLKDIQTTVEENAENRSNAKQRGVNNFEGDPLTVTFPTTWETIEDYVAEGKSRPVVGRGIPEGSSFDIRTLDKDAYYKTPETIAQSMDDKIYETLANQAIKTRKAEEEEAEKQALISRGAFGIYARQAKVNPYILNNPQIDSNKNQEKRLNKEFKEVYKDYMELLPKYMDQYNLIKTLAGENMAREDWEEFINRYYEGIKSKDFENLDIFKVGDRNMATIRFSKNDLLGNEEAVSKIKNALDNALKAGLLLLVRGEKISPRFDHNYNMVGNKVVKEFTDIIGTNNVSINQIDYEPLSGSFLVDAKITKSTNSSNTPVYNAVNKFQLLLKDEGYNGGFYTFKLPIEMIFISGDESNTNSSILEGTKLYREAIAEKNAMKLALGEAKIKTALREMLPLKYNSPLTVGSSGVGYTLKE